MWLEVLTGEDAGRIVNVPPGRPFVLGRVQGADLVVRDARASRLHVELVLEPEGLKLRTSSPPTARWSTASAPAWQCCAAGS